MILQTGIHSLRVQRKLSVAMNGCIGDTVFTLVVIGKELIYHNDPRFLHR